jgi:thiosulfate/3-mercaptopyruvate sulfurtransferase
VNEPLVSAEWLLGHLDDPELVLADVRWYLAGKRGRDAYDAGHIPGARFVDLDRELAAPKGQGPGRHPLPRAATFAALLSRLGFAPGKRIVAYDDAGGAIAARLWWLMRYFGLGATAVLDGGIDAFVAEGGQLSRDEPVDAGAPLLELHPRTELVVDAAAVERIRDNPRATVIDARAPERYQGKSEPIDARPGHVPGAVNLPFAENLAGGRFKPRAELATRFAAALEQDGIVSYCGSGVTACHNLLALSLLGRDDALLYEGSWSDWAADASRPAATGES